MPYILHLLRHAQSAEKQQGQSDKDRDLTSAGRKEAATIGHYLKKNNSGIEIIITSSAQRAQSTASVIFGILNLSSDLVVAEDLYDASIRSLLEFTNQLDDDHKNVLLIGHNPHLSYFAEYLTGAEIGSLETAGLVSIRLNCNQWTEVKEGGGSMESYVYPAIIE